MAETPGWVQDPDGGWHQTIPPRRNGNTWTVAIICVVVVLVVGAGVGAFVWWDAKKDQIEAYCDTYVETGPAVITYMAMVQDSISKPVTTYDSIDARLEELSAITAYGVQILEQRRDAAPSEIRGDWQVLIDSIDSEGNEYQRTQAGRAVDQFAVEHCGLPGDWGSS